MHPSQENEHSIRLHRFPTMNYKGTEIPLEIRKYPFTVEECFQNPPTYMIGMDPASPEDLPTVYTVIKPRQTGRTAAMAQEVAKYCHRTGRDPIDIQVHTSSSQKKESFLGAVRHYQDLYTKTMQQLEQMLQPEMEFQTDCKLYGLDPKKHRPTKVIPGVAEELVDWGVRIPDAVEAKINQLLSEEIRKTKNRHQMSEEQVQSLIYFYTKKAQEMRVPLVVRLKRSWTDLGTLILSREVQQMISGTFSKEAPKTDTDLKMVTRPLNGRGDTNYQAESHKPVLFPMTQGAKEQFSKALEAWEKDVAEGLERSLWYGYEAHGEPVQNDGILSQMKNKGTYNKLTYKQLQDAIGDALYGKPLTTGGAVFDETAIQRRLSDLQQVPDTNKSLKKQSYLDDDGPTMLAVQFENGLPAGFCDAWFSPEGKVAYGELHGSQWRSEEKVVPKGKGIFEQLHNGSIFPGQPWKRGERSGDKARHFGLSQEEYQRHVNGTWR